MYQRDYIVRDFCIKFLAAKSIHEKFLFLAFTSITAQVINQCAQSVNQLYKYSTNPFHRTVTAFRIIHNDGFPIGPTPSKITL